MFPRHLNSVARLLTLLAILASSTSAQASSCRCGVASIRNECCSHAIPKNSPTCCTGESRRACCAKKKTGTIGSSVTKATGCCGSGAGKCRCHERGGKSGSSGCGEQGTCEPGCGCQASQSEHEADLPGLPSPSVRPETTDDLSLVSLDTVAIPVSLGDCALAFSMTPDSAGVHAPRSVQVLLAVWRN